MMTNFSTTDAVSINASASHWHVHRFKAMGSEIAIWLEFRNASRAAQLLHEAEALFRRNEAVLTRFNPLSELMLLNARPERWVSVSATLWRVIQNAMALAQITDGLFDPTLLPALRAAGYDRTFDKLDPENALVPITSLRGRWDDVGLNSFEHAVWLPGGVELDLGGIGKGCTAQSVVNWLSHYGPCMVDAGGDLTMGDPPSSDPGWSVGIATPSSTQFMSDLLFLSLRNTSLATSGIGPRLWMRNGTPQHHIIDPRTGEPANTDLASVSVIANTGVEAEGYATAAMIAGSSRAYRFLIEKGLAAALVLKNGTVWTTPQMTQLAV